MDINSIYFSVFNLYLFFKKEKKNEWIRKFGAECGARNVGTGSGQMVVLPEGVRKANLVHKLRWVQHLCGRDWKYGQEETAGRRSDYGSFPWLLINRSCRSLRPHKEFTSIWNAPTWLALTLNGRISVKSWVRNIIMFVSCQELYQYLFN